MKWKPKGRIIRTNTLSPRRADWRIQTDGVKSELCAKHSIAARFPKPPGHLTDRRCRIGLANLWSPNPFRFRVHMCLVANKEMRYEWDGWNDRWLLWGKKKKKKKAIGLKETKSRSAYTPSESLVATERIGRHPSMIEMFVQVKVAGKSVSWLPWNLIRKAC